MPDNNNTAGTLTDAEKKKVLDKYIYGKSISERMKRNKSEIEFRKSMVKSGLVFVDSDGNIVERRAFF